MTGHWFLPACAASYSNEELALSVWMPLSDTTHTHMNWSNATSKTLLQHNIPLSTLLMGCFKTALHSSLTGVLPGEIEPAPAAHTCNQTAPEQLKTGIFHPLPHAFHHHPNKFYHYVPITWFMTSFYFQATYSFWAGYQKGEKPRLELWNY